MREYIYYTTLRPASPGTIPEDGLTKIEHFEHRTQLAFCKAWSKCTYSEPIRPEVLKAYDMHDNKPDPDQFYKLSKVNALVFFHGTEEEQAQEEKKERHNEGVLKSIYRYILGGDLQAAYFKHKPNPDNGRHLVYILHRSAKYNNLQFTCVMFENDEFLYMCGDHEVIDFNDFLQESNFAGMNGSNVYYF